MRLTFAATMRDAYEGIQSAAERMLTFQRQVSTGMRVTQPSDDPISMASAITEKGSMASYTQYTQAGDSAESRLTVADTILSDIIDKLSAARTAILAVQGSNTTPAQQQTGAQELGSLRDAVLEDLNTKFNGTYMFGGAAGTARPYVKNGAGVVQAYAGSTREVTVEVDRGRSVTIAFDGSALAQGSDPADLFAAFDDAIAAALAGDADALGAASTDLQRAFDRATQAQSSVGTDLRAISDHQGQLANAGRASKARISSLEEANMAEAITGLQQSETAYQASLAAAARTARLSLFDYLR
jgi:flagellar hook-associated protein 3 FlgL